MLKTLLRWMFGFCEIRIPRTDGPVLLTTMLTEQKTHWNLSRSGDMLTFCIPEKELNALLRQSEDMHMEPEIVKRSGLPVLLRRYRNRWGIVLGVILFAVSVFVSERIVWDVRVSGNETMTEQEVVTLLREFGFGVGTWFEPIDFDVFQNRFLMTTDRIAWIAVNMQGNVAHVEIKEMLPSDSETGSGLANIVAAEDGQIEEIRVYSGKSAVAIHDVVEKGDLLISGIQAVREETLRYERAAGSVFARVNRKIVAEVPYQKKEKIYTGVEKTENTLIIFGKRIKLFQNSGISGESYDTIITDTSLTFLDIAALPVTLHTEVLRAYQSRETVREAAEIQLEAYSLYTRKLKELLLSSEVLSMKTVWEWDENGVRLIGKLVCLTDIAVEAPIPIA